MKSLNELLNSAEAKDFLFRAEQNMLPKMRDSAMSLVIGCDPEDVDIKLCLEVGAAVLMDKPLLIVVPPGRKISAGLRRVATEVVELDISKPESQAKFKQAFDRVMAKGKAKP